MKRLDPNIKALNRIQDIFNCGLKPHEQMALADWFLAISKERIRNETT